MSESPRRHAVPNNPRVRSFIRPDRRQVVSCDGAWTVAAVADAVARAGECMLPTLVHVDESDGDSLSLFVEFGFVVSRRESRISIDVDSALRFLSSVRLPPGVSLLSAADVDEEALRHLDDELRGDVPGTMGWQSSRAEFRESTFGDPGFDARTYLVAVDRTRDEMLLGLVRIWMNPTGPRLGLLGVRRHARRRGLGSALLAGALVAVRVAGETRIVTEYDETNEASQGLATRLGAVHLGWTIEAAYTPQGRASGGPMLEEGRSHVLA